MLVSSYYNFICINSFHATGLFLMFSGGFEAIDITLTFVFSLVNRKC